MAEGKAPVTADAVLVVPGIMGSELVDADGNTQWGLKPGLLARAWLTRRMDILHVTQEEIAGERRLLATRLLRVPGYMPLLGGLEPYGALLARVAQKAVDPRAVAEFPYDWRLSIDVNAAELVSRCERHLEAWRGVVAEQRYADPAEVRVVIVAHSMGGLVGRYAIEVLGLGTLVRRLITLGTPYFGAVKALAMLASGEGAPVPRRAARQLALTCPGVYDLLPRYRCIKRAGVGDRRSAATGADLSQPLRLLKHYDVTAVGGDGELAGAAADRWQRLGLRDGSAASTAMSLLAGAEQPTKQSVIIDSGACQFLDSLAGEDHGGDGTVYRQAAAPRGQDASPLPQRHGSLAKSPEALTFVAEKLVGADTGPPLAPTRKIGVDVSDMVSAGERVEARVTGSDDPVGLTVESVDLETGVRTRWPPGSVEDGSLRYRRSLAPGLHRVEVKAGGFSAISDVVLVDDGG